MDFYEVRYDDKAESELEFCKKMYKNHAINSKKYEYCQIGYP